MLLLDWCITPPKQQHVSHENISEVNKNVSMDQKTN